MDEIIRTLPILAVAILMNIGAGLYYNIRNQDLLVYLSFDMKKLVNGVIKALIICGMFVGTAYCFDSTDLSSIGVTPQFIMNSAIVIYVSKSVISLGKILGVDTEHKKE